MEHKPPTIRDSVFPKDIFFVVVLVCILPFFINLFGIDFGTQKIVFDISKIQTMNHNQIVDSAFRVLSGSFVHTLLEWTAFCIAIFTVIMTFVHFKIKKDVATPIVGVALFCAGCMDAFHTLAADRLITSVADIRNLIPFTWAICRLFNALIMIIGVSIFLKKNRKQDRKSFLFVITTSLAFGAISYGIIYLCATSASLPKTMFPGAIISRPWDVAPLIMFLFAGIFIFPRFHKATPSPFSYSLTISVIPQVATQFYMVFGSSSLFDNYFNIAHFIKIIAYFIPFTGLTFEYIRVYRQEKFVVMELESSQIELRNKEALVRGVVENVVDGIITVNDRFEIKSFNLAAEKIFGYKNSEVLEKNINFLMPEPYHHEHNDYIKNYLRTGKKKLIGLTREVVGKRKDESIVSIDLAVSEVFVNKERLFIGIVRDITERKEAEKTIAQARKNEIEVGAKIQKTLLQGKPLKNIPYAKIAAITIPSRQVDGDFYDFFKQSDICFDVLIGDVMGKGVPAALLGAATKSHFPCAINQIMIESGNNKTPTIVDILTLVNSKITKQLIDIGSFVTLCYARFDFNKNIISFVDCGHTRIIHFSNSDNTCVALSGKNMPIGFSEEEVYEEISMPFEGGDIVFLYSDGITEALNKENELFGEKRLVSFIEDNNHLEPEELIYALKSHVIDFSESTRFKDDLTCVVVKIDPKQSKFYVLDILSSPVELSEIRKFLRETLDKNKTYTLSNDSLIQLELAINEAAINIMKHAYGNRKNHKIKIIAEIFSDKLFIKLKHHGKGFNPDTVPPPSFDGSRDNGFGLYMIEQAVDKVTYLENEDGTKCITMMKFWDDSNTSV